MAAKDAGSSRSFVRSGSALAAACSPLPRRLPRASGRLKRRRRVRDVPDGRKTALSRPRRGPRGFPGFAVQVVGAGWDGAPPPTPPYIAFLQARHAEQLGSRAMASSQYPSPASEFPPGTSAGPLALAVPSRGPLNPSIPSLWPSRSAPWLQLVYGPAVVDASSRCSPAKAWHQVAPRRALQPDYIVAAAVGRSGLDEARRRASERLLMADSWIVEVDANPGSDGGLTPAIHLQWARLGPVAVPILAQRIVASAKRASRTHSLHQRDSADAWSSDCAC